MDYVILKPDGRYYCIICDKAGVSTSYALARSVYRHRKVCHPTERPVRISTPSTATVPKKIVVSERSTTSAAAAGTVTLQIQDKGDMIIQMLADLKTRMDQQLPAQNITQINNNNTINIYFNKDLKYYPELVKLIGKQSACDYLLFKMPESRDLFGVLDKLFVKDGVSTCPIRVGDDDEFVVARNTDEYIHDPTGELIDRENKSKLQDAILSAYIDSTKNIDEECEKIRKTRVNGEYSEHDMETINKRFDSAIEPSRPYEVIDIMNGIKPKKKDFDRLRKICPKVVKKIVV